MKFIHRQTELQQLLRLSAAKSGGLAVVWGRRRVGKTRLLLEWSKRENGLYLVGDESAPAIQRKYMADRGISMVDNLGADGMIIVDLYEKEVFV